MTRQSGPDLEILLKPFEFLLDVLHPLTLGLISGPVVDLACCSWLFIQRNRTVQSVFEIGMFGLENPNSGAVVIANGIASSQNVTDSPLSVHSLGRRRTHARHDLQAGLSSTSHRGAVGRRSGAGCGAEAWGTAERHGAHDAHAKLVEPGAAMGPTAAVTGPTGDLGISVVEASEREADVPPLRGRLAGMQTDELRQAFGTGVKTGRRRVRRWRSAPG